MQGFYTFFGHSDIINIYDVIDLMTSTSFTVLYQLKKWVSFSG